MHISKRHNNNIRVKDKIDIADCFSQLNNNKRRENIKKKKFIENKKKKKFQANVMDLALKMSTVNITNWKA